MNATTDLGPVPAHVPPELVRDFDLYNVEGAERDVHEAWRRMKDEFPPVFYTPRYGGYWVVTRADLLEDIWPDSKQFASGKGIGVPRGGPGTPAMLPIEADDPLHQIIRVPLNIALSPKAVKDLSIAARKLCIETIEELKPKGGCDFIADFSLKMPMELFLRMVDLPVRDREYLVGLAGTSLRTSDAPTRQKILGELLAYLDESIHERSKAPSDDLISRIVSMDAGGRPLTHTEKQGYLATTMFGGLDTVGGTMGFIAKHLAEHPEHRAFLRDHPEAIPDAVEEFLRRYGIPTVARCLTHDAVVGDVPMKAGDYVMITTMSHGLDEDRWPNAMTVDFTRAARDHMGFGRGTHRCPGANLARAELRIFIEEWLTRIPDFHIPEGASARSATGSVAGILTLPLVWPVA